MEGLLVHLSFLRAFYRPRAEEEADPKVPLAYRQEGVEGHLDRLSSPPASYLRVEEEGDLKLP